MGSSAVDVTGGEMVTATRIGGAVDHMTEDLGVL